MSTVPPAVPPVDADGVRRGLAAAATRTPLPLPAGSTPTTWGNALFDAAGEWADVTEPSQALLEAFSVLHAGLGDHLATAPARLQGAWLRDIVGIEPLAGAADSVVVAATAEPTATPITIPAGTAVRAKDSAKQDRRYLTSETMTVHGFEVIDVLAHGATLDAAASTAASATASTADDLAVPVHDFASRWADRSVPFDAFAPLLPGSAMDASIVAPHRFFVLADVLAFPSGSMTVRVTFNGASDDVRILDGAVWEFSGPGNVSQAVRVSSTATTVVLQLDGGCAPADVVGTSSPYLCVSLPAGACTPSTLAFAAASVSVEVTQRLEIPIDGAFAGEGKLDATKELVPFGPVPRRGDAFYVRSDEAFGKPLASVTVDVYRPPASQAGSIVNALSLVEAKAKVEQGGPGAVKAPSKPNLPDRQVVWQRFDGTHWIDVTGPLEDLESFTAQMAGAPSQPWSQPIDLGGVGHFVRAYIEDGDFGWTQYQQGIATFSTEAAKGKSGSPDPSALIPPEPPRVTSVNVTYSTVAVSPASLVSIDGWGERRPGSGPHALFSVPFELGGEDAGMIAIGLSLSERALGTAVALYLDVESAPACGADPDSPLRWEYWSADGDWAPLDVADGTSGLRQSGLLRFVAPIEWPEGAAGTSANEGRWIRAVTPDPLAVGVLLAIVPDAVVAVQEPAETAPATAYEPLLPGQVKGLLIAAPGIKKLTNPIGGVPGRAPEAELDATSLERAAGAVRHRWRAANAWDCEQLIHERFPEVAALRCLPHTNPSGASEPGWIGAVVVPQSTDRMPLPSMSLAERIRNELQPAMAVHAQLAVLCPLYVPVTVDADLILTPGAAAIDARVAITAALEAFLHPTANRPARFGRELFASTVAAWIETRPEVDHLTRFVLLAPGPGAPTPAPVERVTVDPCRGMIASAGDHLLKLTEQL